LRAFFRWAVAKQIICNSPCDGLEAPSRERPGGRERVLDEDEIRLFWSGCEAIGAPFGDLFKLLLLTAQRMGSDLLSPASWWYTDLGHARRHGPS
jgi:integrase